MCVCDVTCDREHVVLSRTRRVELMTDSVNEADKWNAVQYSEEIVAVCVILMGEAGDRI